MKKDPTYIFPYFHLTNFKNVPSFTWKFIHLFGTLEYFVSWFVLLKKNTTNWIRLIRGQPLNFRLSVWRMITKGSLQINTASLFKVHLSYGPLAYFYDIFMSDKNIVISQQKWQHFGQKWKHRKNIQADQIKDHSSITSSCFWLI